MRALVFLFITALVPSAAVAYICAEGVEKQAFKRAEVVVLAETINVAGCSAQVEVRKSFKGSLKPGTVITVFEENSHYKGCALFLGESVFYLGNRGDFWAPYGCRGGGFEAGSPAGAKRLARLERRAWWWRLPVSSLGREGFRRWRQRFQR